MKRLLRSLLLAVALAASVHAAEPLGDVTLKTGKVLHHAKLLSDQYDSLVLFCAEGMIKVRKVDLPPELLQKYPERPAPPPPPPVMISRPMTIAPFDEPEKPIPVPRPAPADPNLFKGCLITGYEQKPVQGTLGCVEVTIPNSSETPLPITPAMFRCVTSDGKVHPGMRFFVPNDNGAFTMKKSDVVPASGDLKDVVFFQQFEMEIQSLTWAK